MRWTPFHTGRDVLLWVAAGIVIIFFRPPAYAGAGALAEGPGWDSPYGIDYVFPYSRGYQDPGLPRTFAETGARWVNFAGPGLGWRKIEPRAPTKGTHRYRWKTLDKAVRAWQGEGFNIVMTLTCGSTWGGGPVTGDILLMEKIKPLGKAWAKKVDRLPAPEHMADYRAYVQALVERYDGDGEGDMPGLKIPVLYYQVGNEYVHEAFWGGTLADYGLLLKETYTAAKAACPEVRIIIAGITWNDLFRNDLAGETFEERFQAKLETSNELVRKGWEKARRFTEGELEFTRWYDIVDARGNGPYPNAFPGYIRWVRKELAADGADKEIWDMESRTEPAVVYNKAAKFHEEAYCKNGAAILRRMGSTRNRERSDLWRWYRAEQARQTVKVLATRLGAGMRKVFIGFPIDNDFNFLAKLGSGANPWVGLLDKDYAPQPAFHAYKQFVSTVGCFEDVRQRIEGDFWRYTFTAPGRTVHVLWYDDGAPPDPERPPGKKKVSLPVGSRLVKVTPTVTSLSAVTPRGRIHSARDGKITLTLTGTPVFIEEL